jgi:hypothetical protein
MATDGNQRYRIHPLSHSLTHLTDVRCWVGDAAEKVTEVVQDLEYSDAAGRLSEESVQHVVAVLDRFLSWQTDKCVTM